MPIFEYFCENCENEFESLEMPGEKTTECPECKSKRIKKLVSGFSSPNITVLELSVPEAGYSGAERFNQKLRKGELENPVEERRKAVKKYRENSPLFKKGEGE